MNKLMTIVFGGFFWGYSLLSNFVLDFNLYQYEVLVADSEINYNFGYNNIASLKDTLPPDTAKTCVDCHDDYLKGEVIHAPVKKDCLRCHIPNGAEHPKENIVGFDIKQSVPDLCYECHDAKNEEEFVHDPISKGDCSKCHEFHNSENLYLVKSDPVSKLCYECHDLEIPKGNHIHGAVKDGDCTGCHNPHQADNKDFLATRKLDRLCKKCHKIIRKELKKDFVHEPFKKKKCFDCHNAHSSKEEHLSDVKNKELCLSCHDVVHKELGGAKIIHGAIDKPQSCLNCHAAHASDHDKILKFNNVEMCLHCHDESMETETRTIEAIGPHLVEGNTIHGAITEEGCSACHNAHVSEEKNLLHEHYPNSTYVKPLDDNFSLCFKCHEKELITEKTTLTATNFRDGELNLHFIHVNENKARNCTTCHDVHGAENKYMIKESTAFGKWDMPIKFNLYNNGGSCLTGCHKEHKYERIVQDSLMIKDTISE